MWGVGLVSDLQAPAHRGRPQWPRLYHVTCPLPLLVTTGGLGYKTGQPILAPFPPRMWSWDLRHDTPCLLLGREAVITWPKKELKLVCKEWKKKTDGVRGAKKASGS